MALVTGLALAMPAVAEAAPATTGAATAVTSISATLNGAVDTTSSTSYWLFTYGTSMTNLDQATASMSVGAGSRSVSVPITNLTPATKYYYRLIVVQVLGPMQNLTSQGGIVSFTTPTPSTAATGDATYVTDTSATLNGVASSTAAGSAWAFQFGPTTAYGQATQGQLIGVDVRAVSVTLTKLKPATVYHFRLLIDEGTDPRHVVVGSDRSFTTKPAPPKFGRASLARRRLIVHHRHVAVVVRCRGATGASCAGRLTITAGGKRTIGCGRASFSIGAGDGKTLKARIGRGCLKLLARARHHRIHGRLRVRFSTAQRQLKAGVTLIKG
jgi:hypothetical protein